VFGAASLLWLWPWARVSGGWAIDRYIRRGGSTTFGYKLVMGVAHVGAMLCMLCVALGSRPVALAAIFVYQALCGFQAPGVFAISQIIAGPAAAGRWVSIQNGIGNVAGAVAPALSGFIVDWTGHFALAFVLAAAVGVVGFTGWIFMIPRIAELDWRAQRVGGSALAAARLG
jgi:MFS family permease